MLSSDTHRVLLLLAILIAAPALGLLALTLHRRLPPALVPGALMVLPAEAGSLVGAAGAGATAAAGVAGRRRGPRRGGRRPGRRARRRAPRRGDRAEPARTVVVPPLRGRAGPLGHR